MQTNQQVGLKEFSLFGLSDHFIHSFWLKIHYYKIAEIYLCEHKNIQYLLILKFKKV